MLVWELLPHVQAHPGGMAAVAATAQQVKPEA